MSGDEGGRRTFDEQIRELVRRAVEAIPKPQDGRTPVKGKDYRDGHDVDMDEVRARIAREVGKIRKPEDGEDGDDGLNGWTPVLAVVPHGERRVLQLVRWVGGEGAPPDSGFYLGPDGPVSRAEDATDIRGAPGADGGLATGGGSDTQLRKFILEVAGGDGAAAVTAHVAEPDPHSQYATDAEVTAAAAAVVATHVGQADPHTQYQKESEKGQALGYAGLDAAAMIPAAYLPAIAITDTFEVASEAAMLALTAERGDVAVRSDENKTYILKTDDPTQLANWVYLKTPTDTVLSVDGQTGAVSLSAVYAAIATQIIAGAGLTGGGTLAASRTLAVGAGTGITVNADDVALDTSHARNVDHSAVTLTAGAGLTGGGDISANRSFAVNVDASTIEINANALRVKALGITDSHVAAANKDGTAATPSMRTLGTGAAQAAAGNHDHSGVYQPSDAELTALAGLASAADKLPYFTAAGAAALADLSTFFRTLTGSASLAALMPLIGIQAKVVSGSDATTTSASVQDITGLSFAIGANEKWLILGTYRTTCNNSGGIKYAINGPSGATPVMTYFLTTSSGTAFGFTGNIALATVGSTPGNTVNGTGGVLFGGTIVNGATPGTVQMQFASTTGGQTSTILIGSTIAAIRIA